MQHVKTIRRIGCLAALAVGLSLLGGPAPAPAGDPARDEPAKGRGEAPAKAKRIAYVVKYGTAKNLAALLRKHFKEDVEVEAVPDAPSNCLLIRAAPAAFAEVVKLLAELDRRPQTVAVEVLIAEAPPAKGAAKPGEGKEEPDDKELTGPIADVVKRAAELQKAGVLAGLKRIQLTAVEHHPASVLLGELRPVVSGARTLPGGTVSRTLTYRNVGSQVKVTPRVVPGKKVMLDLEVSEARLFVPADGIVLGKDENGQVLRATEFLQAKLATTLAVPSGQAVVARGVKTTAKAGQPRTLIIVAARVLEPEPGAEK
jgi:hypothetical protein